MSAKKAILEIDGHSYDSHSGEFASRRTRSIDGFVGSKNIGHLSSPKRPELHNIVNRPTMSDIVRSGENHLAKTVEPSKTLMRTVVKKPSIVVPKKIKSHSKASALPTKKPAHKLSTKLSVANVDHLRSQRAISSTKSHSVAKFTKTKPVARQHVAVPAPIAQDFSPRAHNPSLHKKNRTTHDLFEEALAHATSHTEPHHIIHKTRRIPKQAGVLVAVFGAVLALSGVFAGQNMDNVKLYLAASKAGFSASLPDYQPAGYHLSKVNSDAGIVAANFMSNSDERSYSLTQQPSKWDSQALRDVHLAKNHKDYYAVEKNGQTIYIYGDHNATWVNGGVWYQLSGNGSLSDRQLLDLATSL